MSRLTPEREAQMRKADGDLPLLLDVNSTWGYPQSAADRRALLAELDATRADLKAAESRVRAAVIADLRGLLERAYPSSHLYGSSLVVDADSVESLIIELESQQ